MLNGVLKRFAVDTRGSVAMMAAGSIATILLIAGIATDYTRLTSTNATLQDIVDNSALAALSQLELTDAQRQQVVASNLDMAMNSLGQDIAIRDKQIGITDNGMTVTVKVKVDVPLLFGGFIGEDLGVIEQSAVASRGIKEIPPTSIVFVLDASGSMIENLGSKKRIDVLKETVNDMFSELAVTAGSDFDAKSRIRTGVYAYNWGIRDKYSAPLSYGWAHTVEGVNEMELGSATIPTQAMEAALADLRSEPDFFGVEKVKKIIVFMTDGEIDDHLNMNGKHSEYNVGEVTGVTEEGIYASGKFTRRTLKVCKAAAKDGISVIAVGMGAPESGRKVLEACAEFGDDPITKYVNTNDAGTFDETLRLAIPKTSGVAKTRLVR